MCLRLHNWVLDSKNNEQKTVKGCYERKCKSCNAEDKASSLLVTGRLRHLNWAVSCSAHVVQYTRTPYLFVIAVNIAYILKIVASNIAYVITIVDLKIAHILTTVAVSIAYILTISSGCEHWHCTYSWKKVFVSSCWLC